MIAWTLVLTIWGKGIGVVPGFTSMESCQAAAVAWNKEAPWYKSTTAMCVKVSK